jgi:hypothetical protein
MRVLLGALAALSVAGGAVAQTPTPAPRMTMAEGLQVLQAAGFRLQGAGALNLCDTPAKPKFTYMDLNGDGAPEAVAVDKNPACYGGAGDWFTVIAKGRDGRWRAIMRESGTLAFEPTRTAGWLDARVTSNCPRIWRWGGDGYVRPEACAPTTAAVGGITAADRDAALRAAGFRRSGDKWVDGDGQCEAFIEPEGVRDLNGDGRPEIVVTGSGTFCYGNTGQGYFLMQRSVAGAWRKIDQNQGIPKFLPTRGAGGWQDIEVGGPGFCFPVLRFDGKAYAFNRNKEYEKGACARR